jgi:hypothetical protein
VQSVARRAVSIIRSSAASSSAWLGCFRLCETATRSDVITLTRLPAPFVERVAKFSQLRSRSTAALPLPKFRAAADTGEQMRFEKQTIKNGPVYIDGNEFFDCLIEGVEVRYAGGGFSLSNTHFRNVQFAFGGHADATLAFLRLLAGASGGEQFVMTLITARPLEFRHGNVQ